MNTIEPIIVAYVEFTEGERRPVFEDASGRQYVEREDGQRVYGVWYIPREIEIDQPTIVGDDPF